MTVTAAPAITITGPDAFGCHRFTVDGREVVTVRQESATEWSVTLTAYRCAPRYYRGLEAALVEGTRMAAQYTRCRKPVACRLCRLPARHDGPCVPWS